MRRTVHRTLNSYTRIGLSVCMFACLHVCMSACPFLLRVSVFCQTNDLIAIGWISKDIKIVWIVWKFQKFQSQKTTFQHCKLRAVFNCLQRFVDSKMNNKKIYNIKVMKAKWRQNFQFKLRNGLWLWLFALGTSDRWHVIWDTWYLTFDTWHMKPD